MTQLLRIRKDILRLTQAEMAEIAGATQATVSRWESGELEPSRDQIEMILVCARGKGIDLSPADFFDIPASDDAPPPQAIAG